jgi:hypothetical protein
MMLGRGYGAESTARTARKSAVAFGMVRSQRGPECSSANFVFYIESEERTLTGLLMYCQPDGSDWVRSIRFDELLKPKQEACRGRIGRFGTRNRAMREGYISDGVEGFACFG